MDLKQVISLEKFYSGPSPVRNSHTCVNRLKKFSPTQSIKRTFVQKVCDSHMYLEMHVRIT